MATADVRPGNTPIAAPDDAALRGAVLLQQPKRLVEVLSPRLTEWLDPGARLVDSHVAIRRHVPGKRCIFELELVIATRPEERAGASGRSFRDGKAGEAAEDGVGGATDAVEVRTVMGKLYAGDEGAQVYDTLQRLWASGFSTGPLTVPRPIAYDPDWRILLTGRARGMVLRQLLLRQAEGGRREAEAGRDLSSAFRTATSASLCTAVEQSAAWLVKLHTSGVTGRRWYTFDRHLYTLALWQVRLVDVYPEATSLLASVLARIEARGHALPAWEAAPTHRDFSPDNIVFDGMQLSAVDFDEYCQYDPLFDVAHFVAHLRLLGLTSSGTGQRFDELATRFQMAYQVQAKGYSAARVRLYEAITYFKVAHILACIARPSGWQQSVATLLREAQRIV